MLVRTLLGFSPVVARCKREHCYLSGFTVLATTGVWIPLTYFVTITSNASDYSFYIPSFGLALALASIVTQPVRQQGNLVRVFEFAATLVLLVGYSLALFSRNQAYHRAGQVAEAIPRQVKSLYPALPSDARLVFVGVPDKTPAEVLVYRSGFGSAIAMAYRNPQIEMHRFAKFPIWLDKLDRTFFFLVDHRRVAERGDLVRALTERERCATVESIAVDWDFSKDTQGWEPWNQLATFEIRNGVLSAQAEGNDPYMGSPLVDMSALWIGNVEIAMRVLANQPTLQGEVYWLASGQMDFSPDLKETFRVQADGEYHTYRVDIAQSGKLLMGDRISRLRLDPVDGKANIEIKAIKVFIHCSTMPGADCQCPR